MINLNEGIAVDSAHSTKNRKTEFKGVDLKTGKTLFYCDLGNQTINIGEFLAIVEAVKYIIEHDFHPKVIFSDSTTAISWFKNKRTASGKRNDKLMKAEIYLRAMAYWIDEIEVVKWDNKSFGEIPADFNRK
ncbi:ribonuclease H [Parabacteroides sp.]